MINLKNEKIKLKHFNNDLYLEKDDVIWNKTCPHCKKIILSKDGFCRCGFFTRGRANANYWLITILTYSIIAGFFVLGFINLINSDILNFDRHLEKLEINQFTPATVQVKAHLKDTPGHDCIQNIYVNPHQEEELKILIKPNLWHILNEEEKAGLLIQAKFIWTDIYKKNNPSAKKEVSVSFANRD